LSARNSNVLHHAQRHRSHPERTRERLSVERSATAQPANLTGVSPRAEITTPTCRVDFSGTSARNALSHRVYRLIDDDVTRSRAFTRAEGEARASCECIPRYPMYPPKAVGGGGGEREKGGRILPRRACTAHRDGRRTNSGGTTARHLSGVLSKDTRTGCLAGWGRGGQGGGRGEGEAPRETKEHRRNDARGVFRRAIVTCRSDVHRATGAVPCLFLPPPSHPAPPPNPPGGALLDTEMQGIVGISFPNVTREGPGIEPSKPRGGCLASPTPRRSPSWLLLTRKEEGSCE